MPRRSIQKIPADFAPLVERLRLLCEMIWGRNQTRMANDTGLSAPTVSRSLSGEIDPTSLTLKVAMHPSVNANWLLTGRGLPLSANDGGSGATRYLPTTIKLLSGPVSESPAAFSGMRYPIPDSMFSESRYWHQISKEEAKFEELKWMPDDQVLIETEAAWIKDPSILIGRPLVLRLEQESEPCFGLCQPENLIQDDQYFFAELEGFSVFTVIIHPLRSASGKKTKPLRLIVGSRPPGVVPKELKGAVHLTPSNVVGIVLRSDRIYGSLQ